MLLGEQRLWRWELGIREKGMRSKSRVVEWIRLSAGEGFSLRTQSDPMFLLDFRPRFHSQDLHAIEGGGMGAMPMGKGPWIEGDERLLALLRRIRDGERLRDCLVVGADDYRDAVARALDVLLEEGLIYEVSGEAPGFIGYGLTDAALELLGERKGLRKLAARWRAWR